MPAVEGGYVNPFYQQVDDNVIDELNSRGRIYGARVRSTRKQAAAFPNDLVWAYGKIAFVQIIPEDPRAPKMGLAASKVMSDRKGNLTLYDSTRNQPKYPLLQSLEISNEGTIGSLLKGKFTFTIYPDLTDTGFQIENLEESYFKPGRAVKIKWGWSAHANNTNANVGEMNGIIYNFNWTINIDLSITADVSIVSKSTIAMGVSGEQTNPESDSNTKDPLGNVIPDGDIPGIIAHDLQELGKSNTSVAAGQKSFFGRDVTPSGKKLTLNGISGGLQYFVIGMPKSPKDTESGPTATQGEEPVEPLPPPITEPTYYVKLSDLTELVNGLLTVAERTSTNGSVVEGISSLFYVVCDGNETEYLPDIVSCTPEQVFFPDRLMGKYGNFAPWWNADLLTTNNAGKVMTDNTINIGNILISTTAVIEAYTTFIKENQTSIELKNITSFFDAIIKKINYASGETYQLTTRLLEPEQITLPGAVKKEPGSKAILSIEDSNLSKKSVDIVKAFQFNSSIAKPILKNISISSNPPGPAASAAYAEARSQKGGSKLGPQQSDVRTAQHKEIDEAKYQKEFDEALSELTKTKENFISIGASDKFTSDLKSSYAKYKRAATGGAHWLNRAIYPVDLSITIDGINGFKFGDVIKTNLIPSTYNLPDVDMVFVVTKISHSVKDGIWETKLDTKSRINMGNGAANAEVIK